MRNISGSSVARAVIGIAVAGTMSVALLGCTSSANTRMSAWPEVDCMFKVVQATTGVSDAHLSYETSDGKTRPTMSFTTERGTKEEDYLKVFGIKPHTDKSKAEFYISHPGPPRSFSSLRLARVVMDAWQAQCNVSGDYGID